MTGRFEATIPNTRLWSMAGAHFDEKFATKLAVDP